jgi:hypothetical protein
MFLKRYTDGQVCEEMLNITNHRGNANQNHNKILSHSHQDGQYQQKQKEAGCWWITSAILATWEVEIKITVVQGQPRQIVQETLS